MKRDSPMKAQTLALHAMKPRSITKKKSQSRAIIHVPLTPHDLHQLCYELSLKICTSMARDRMGDDFTKVAAAWREYSPHFAVVEKCRGHAHNSVEAIRERNDQYAELLEKLAGYLER